MENKTFNVLMWDFNHDELIHYDVLPYLREVIEENLKRKNKNIKVIKSFDDLKELIEKESMYRYWSRCEYEMIIHGWPVQKKDYKIDIHEQIMMNIDVISDILFDEYLDKIDKKNKE